MSLEALFLDLMPDSVVISPVTGADFYGNPTFGALSWSALPFSLAQTGAIDRHIHTATSEGALDIFVEQKAVKGFYYVSFRVPGADTGTPGSGGGGAGGGPGGPPPGRP